MKRFGSRTSPTRTFGPREEGEGVEMIGRPQP